MKVIQFNQNFSSHKKRSVNNRTSTVERMGRVENKGNVPAPQTEAGVGATTSSIKAFFTSKAGIILLSVLGTVVITTAVVVPMIVTQQGEDSINSNNSNNNSKNPTSPTIIIDAIPEPTEPAN